MRLFPFLLTVTFLIYLFPGNAVALTKACTISNANAGLKRDTVLNAKSFGVVGDGKQNDGPALQKAIDEAARTMTTLLIPAGTYYIASGYSLRIPSMVTIEGSGKEKSLLVTDSIMNPAFPTLINIEGEQITLRNIGISGGRPIAADEKSKASTGRYTLINISFDTKASENILIEDCRLSDAHGRGLLFKGKNITIRDCDFLRLGRYSIDFKAVDGAISNFGRNECSDIRIVHNTFRFIGTHAVSAYRINRLNVVDNYLSYISGIGLANHQCQNIRITENRIEYTGDNGIDVQRCQQTLISANYFYCAGNKNAGDAGSAAAIFYGDDYATGTGNKAIISNNFIRGDFNFETDTLPSRSQGCGIYIIDAFHLKVIHNTINGIGDNNDRRKIIGIEDGNGIMIVNSNKGQSQDIVIDGNSIFDTKNHALLVAGQGREIKIVNNVISGAGGQGIYLSAVATNLFGSITNNTVTDGRNWFNLKVAADIFVEAKNGWLTNLNISSNQLRNNKRGNYQKRNDSVFTTHGIYFTGIGFARFNNLIVADNQVTGHNTDEIGFSDVVSSYFVNKDNIYPATGFRHNYSGTTDDSPADIIPGYNQKQKPWIITESYAVKVPEYGNYSKGSVILNPANPPQRWVAMNSGFAAQNRWERNKPVSKGQTIIVGTKVWRCVKGGRTGSLMFSIKENTARDGSVTWEDMGNRVLFKAFAG